MLRLPLSVSRAFALRSASDTSVCPLVLGDRGPRARPQSWTLLSRYGPCPAWFRGDRRLCLASLALRAALRAGYLRCAPVPSFPEDPVAALPCSKTPGGPPRQTIAALRRGPRDHHNEGSTIHIEFRDSITRLHDSLPTLEGAISGRQPRLASSGWSVLSGRDGSRRVSPVAFSCSLSASPFGWLLLTFERLPRRSGLWLAPVDF